MVKSGKDWNEKGSAAFRALSFGARFTKKTKKAKTKDGNGEAKLDTNIEPRHKVPRLSNEGKTPEENGHDLSQTVQIDSPVLLEGLQQNVQNEISTKTDTSKPPPSESDQLRKANRIFVWGSDIASPVESFEQLPLLKKLKKRLLERQFLSPTAVQMQAIPLMLQHREMLVSAPTGSGKTLAFALPIVSCLHKLKNRPENGGPLAVVLEPTRELAKQTYQEFRKLCKGLSISASLFDENHKTGDILISTPNRLVYALKQSETAPNLEHVRWLVVDESDKLFEAGRRGFRDQLAAVYQACSGAQVRRAFFSATFSYEVEEWCKTNLDNVVMLCVGPRNSAVKSVEQKLIFAGSEHGKLVAIRQMVRDGLNIPVLIFVQSKDRAEQLHSELRYDGVIVDMIHSDREQTERDRVVKNFHDGKLWVLICTELLGRGIDFVGVNLVINYDLPSSVISYIHRIGRTGRAGRAGQAVTFFTEQDRKALRPIATVIEQAGFTVPEYTLQLRKPSRRLKKRLQRRAPERQDISNEGANSKKRIRRRKRKSKEMSRKTLCEQTK